MAGKAVGAMQRKMFIEAGHAQKFLQSRLIHARGVTEAHVIVDQSKNLRRVVVGEAQALTDFLGDLDADIDVIIETNAVGRHAERCRLAHVVQQRAPGQRRRARMRQILQQQQRVDKHVALGMKLRRLLRLPSLP